MKYLAMDLGTKTCGLALSDKLGIIASPYKVIRYNSVEELIEEIKKITELENVDELVLGLPKNMNNTMGDRALTTLEFKEKLESYLNKKVNLMDERLSTVAAHNYMLESDMSRKKRKEKVDALAANIILQSYLDKKGK